MIRGDVTTADGRSWSFTDPCMTTWEAEELWAWLEMASRNAADREEAVFLEPNVSFFIEGRHGERVRVQVGFSHESLPGGAGQLTRAALPPSEERRQSPTA